MWDYVDKHYIFWCFPGRENIPLSKMLGQHYRCEFRIRVPESCFGDDAPHEDGQRRLRSGK